MDVIPFQPKKPTWRLEVQIRGGRVFAPLGGPKLTWLIVRRALWRINLRPKQVIAFRAVGSNGRFSEWFAGNLFPENSRKAA